MVTVYGTTLAATQTKSWDSLLAPDRENAAPASAGIRQELGELSPWWQPSLERQVTDGAQLRRCFGLAAASVKTRLAQWRLERFALSRARNH